MRRSLFSTQPIAGAAISLCAVIGCQTWFSRLVSRPSRKMRCTYATFSRVGELRSTERPSTPTAVRISLLVKPCSGMWQVAQAKVSLSDSRRSKNSLRPSSMRARVSGLPAGTGTGGRPSGGRCA